MSTLNPATSDIVAKLWNLCNVLRDDGVTYHQYMSELTYLLFLKMMQETDQEARLIVRKPVKKGDQMCDEAGAKWPPVGSRTEHRVEQFWGHSDWHEYGITMGFQVLRIERSATVKDLRPLCTIDGHENCASFFRQHARRWK